MWEREKEGEGCTGVSAFSGLCAAVCYGIGPVIWREANTFSGWILIAASLIGLVITYFKPDVARKHGAPLLVTILGAAVIISFIYVNFLPG